MSFTASRSWAFTQMLRGIKNAKAIFFLALALASLSLTVPAFVGTMIYSLAEPLRAVPLAPEITVFAYQPISDDQMKNLQERLKRHDHVVKFEVIDREVAYQSLNESLGLKETPESATNPLPDLLIVTLESDLSPEEIEKTADSINKLKGVSSVAYDSKWLARLDALYQALISLGGTLVAITVALLLCVIAASVRLAADAQKKELQMLYLFGASNNFSTRPYAWRGFTTMGLASVLALGLSSIATHYANDALTAVALQYGVELSIAPLPWEINVAFVALCAILGWTVANIMTRRAIKKVEKTVF